ncbi:hypothetical protein Tco_1442567 [Tanacetum coccineum]
MCRQPLPPPLYPSSVKLTIMALEEYGYQRNGGLLIPVTSFKKKVMKVLEMNEEGLRWLESYELMIDLKSIRDPESINF